MDVWADTLRLPHNIRTGARSRCNSQTTLYKYLHDTNYDSIGILLHGLPRFTTAPMEGVTEITGHPAISLNITSPTNYAIVFMYLIETWPRTAPAATSPKGCSAPPTDASAPLRLPGTGSVPELPTFRF